LRGDRSAWIMPLRWRMTRRRLIYMILGSLATIKLPVISFLMPFRYLPKTRGR